MSMGMVLTTYARSEHTRAMPRKPQRPAAPPPDELVPIQFRLSRNLIAALDAIVEKRRAADPYIPLTRTDIVREALVKVVKGEAP